LNWESLSHFHQQQRSELGTGDTKLALSVFLDSSQAPLLLLSVAAGTQTQDTRHLAETVGHSLNQLTSHVWARGQDPMLRLVPALTHEDWLFEQRHQQIDLAGSQSDFLYSGGHPQGRMPNLHSQ
jgi:hypothetical protein